MPPPSDLDIVVVAYGSRDLLRSCLQSLREHPLTLGTMAVHVVDNASGDGTVDMLRTEFPEVNAYPLEANAGFSAGNNLVLAASRAPFALLLNPDTEVHPGTLDHMVGLMRERADVGMAGCRLIRPDGSLDHAAKRSFPTPTAALVHFFGLTRNGLSARLPAPDYVASHVGESDVGEVDAINGAFMLVRREAIAEVGLLDRGYWLYMEDLDWCYRFKQRGWRVLYDGRVSALHVKGGTAGRHRRLRQNVAFHRGMGRFFRKFQAGRSPLMDVVVYLGIGAKLCVSILRGTAVRARLL